MKNNAIKILEGLLDRYPVLTDCKESIEKAYEFLKRCYLTGGKVLICGNGGSAADSEHIAAELMKGFILKRTISKQDSERIKSAFPDDWLYISENLQGALPAISLVSQVALAYAYINDVASDMVFAQQVYGYAREGDVLIGLSTSGDSKNVVNAIKVAKAFGMVTIGLTGEKGGVIKDICDAVIMVPGQETYKIQELHLPVYHALCAMIEVEFFDV